MSSSIVDEFPGLEADPLYGELAEVSPHRAIGLFDGSRRIMAVLVQLGIVTETLVEGEQSHMIYAPKFDFDQVDWGTKINTFLDDSHDARQAGISEITS